jgi:outer membrane protein OmpA-like peptidoglycan-associated protein
MVLLPGAKPHGMWPQVRGLRALAVVLCLSVGTLSAQPMKDVTGLTKQMNMAIKNYEKGDDLEAMDLFMEILVKGDPVERPMANEYLNLLTQRMALGAKFDAKLPPRATVIEEVQPQVTQAGVRVPRPRRPAALPKRAPSKSLRRSQGKLSKSDRAVMRREIEAKITNRTRVLLGRLRKYQDLNVRMANSRRPRAIGIPAGMLFESGTRFKKDAAAILKLLEHLVFSLGATQVVILPERALQGDSKILDMRRTMGISSHLLRAGVAPARVRVNLLSSQVEVPRDMLNFSGVLVLFIYNQPLQLNTESAIGTQAGPPISLGVSPSNLDPRKGEGTIIEISVLEPPAGLMSWRFQLLGPGVEAEGDLVPIQEVKGSAPVFHQIYWNARSRYFGAELAPGRYEAVLTATDLRNRTRKVRKWLKVSGTRVKAVAKKAPRAAATSSGAGLPPATLPGAPTRKRGRTMSKRKRRPRRTRRKKVTRKKASATVKRTATPKPAPVKTPQAAEQAAAPRSNTVNYTIPFSKDTANIKPRGENTLTRVADTMHYYPLDNINLVGYASSGEPDAQGLARRRAELVTKLLVEKHSMKRDRIRLQQKIVDATAPKVEVYISRGGS